MAAEKVEKLVNGNITNDKGEIMVKEADHRFQMPVLPCPFGGENTTHMIEPPAYKKSGGDQGSEVTVNAGFGAPYSTPLTAGGSYVQRADVNGMGYLATMFHFFAQCGGIMQFDQNVSNAIGGYPPGAVLAYLPDKDEIVTDGSNTQVAMFANELVYVKNIAKDGTGKGTVNANNIRQGKWTGWKICTLARRELSVLDGKKQDKGNFVTTDEAQSGISPTKGWTGKHTFTGGVDVNSKLALNASGEIDAKSAKSVKVPTPSGTNYSEHNADYAASIGWVREFHKMNDKEGGGGTTIVDNGCFFIDPSTHASHSHANGSSVSGKSEHDICTTLHDCILLLHGETGDPSDANGMTLHLKKGGRDISINVITENKETHSDFTISIPLASGVSVSLSHSKNFSLWFYCKEIYKN